ncbi:DNA-binding protein [Pseudoxanthomonas sp. SGD-10]|nr:DNA-binding protein [Pseudoxanthomonas sp. SGD-10]
MAGGSEEIFTLEEVAAYLKVGKRTVYRLVAAQELPAFKVGGSWRFRRQEIDQWINEQTITEQSGGASRKRPHDV